MKRVAAILLAILVMAGITPVSALASNSVIYIRNAEELIALANKFTLDSASRGKTVRLMSDIDLSGVSFSPIPLLSGRFCGDGHTISGLNMSDTMSEAGLFRRILQDGVVEKLNVIGTVAPGDGMCSVGGIAGTNYGVIRECSFTGGVRGRRGIGGICGVNYESGVVEGCRTEGVAEGQHRVGGIVGENAGVVRGCANASNINENVTQELVSEMPGIGLKAFELTLSAEELVDITDIGGIAGFSTGIVRACDNDGAVGHKLIGYNVGGIVGNLSGYLEQCENRGAVFGRKDVGGIVGQIDPDTGWSFSPDRIEELRQRLDALMQSMTRLSKHAADKGAGLSEELSQAFTALGAANAALETITDDTIAFINGNVEAVNTLSMRVTEALTSAVPILEELSAATNDFAEGIDALSNAFERLAETAALTDDIVDGVTENIEGAVTAVENARTALDEIAALIAAFSADPDGMDIAELISAIYEQINTLRTALSEASSAVGGIFGALNGLSEVGEPLYEALSLLSEASVKISDALDSLGRAEALLRDALDSLSQYEAILFTPLNDNADARRRLFKSLDAVASSMRNAAYYIGDTELYDDLNEVTEELFGLIAFLTDSLEGIVKDNGEDVITDESNLPTDRRRGRVTACSSSGNVEAETNCGGIIGAITVDISFDLDDEFNLSSLLAGRAKYVIFAYVSGCSCSANVSATKDYAGGIVGRMDYGAIACSEACGAVSASSYAGGIAGSSLGSITDCLARTNLYASKYAGGIAGFGHDIAACLSLPSIEEGGEYNGAIAGDADGELKANYYTSCDIGGVNGFSFAGIAQGLDYQALVERSGDAELFKTVTVTFLSDEGATLVTIPFGGSVTELPAVPCSAGRSWRWDAFDNETITKNLTVSGGYFAAVTVLSTGGELPEILVEGNFEEGQTLSAIEFPTSAEGATVSKTLLVDGFSGELTVRCRMDKRAELYIMREGISQRASYSRDGSYAVFKLQNGASFTFVEIGVSSLLTVIIVAGAALLIAAVIAAVFAQRKRRKDKALNNEADVNMVQPTDLAV